MKHNKDKLEDELSWQAGFGCRASVVCSFFFPQGKCGQGARSG